MEDELQTTVISVGNDNNSSSSSGGPASPPLMPLNSPGSSVSVSSSKLKEEYSQLLKSTLDCAPGLGALLSSLQGSITDFAGAAGGGGSPRSSRNKSLNGNKNNDRNKNNDSFSESTSDSLEASVNSMRCKLTGWMDELKEKILGEMEKSLTCSAQVQNNEFKKATKCVLVEKGTLQKEVNNLTERVNDLECSLGQKNTLVKNMSDNICSQKQKLDQAKCFYAWKTECADKDRECFTEKLAYEHHSKKLALRVLKAWYSLIQSRWRCRVERQCQTQAKSLCMNLSSDYEIKVCMLNEKIQSLEEKVCLLQQEREMYSEQVKKAFMRGMCALNVETMSILTESDGNPDQPRSMPPSNTYDDDVPVTVTYSNTQPVTLSRTASKNIPMASSQTGIRATCSVPGVALQAASSQGVLRNACSTPGMPVQAASSQGVLRNACSAAGVPNDDEEVPITVTYSNTQPGQISRTASKYLAAGSSQTALRNTCSAPGLPPRNAYSTPGIPNGQAYPSQTRLQPACSSAAVQLDPNQSSQYGIQTVYSGAGLTPEPNYSSQTTIGIPMSCSVAVMPGHPAMCMMDSEMQTSNDFLHNQTSTTELDKKQKSSPKGKKAKGGKGKGKGTKNKTHNAAVSSIPLAPPMASVVVERHPAINKQTLGKATAVKFPKKTKDDMVNEVVRGKSLTGHFQPIAGQNGMGGKLTSNNMCIRVVE